MINTQMGNIYLVPCEVFMPGFEVFVLKEMMMPCSQFVIAVEISAIVGSLRDDVGGSLIAVAW